jgi:hypothetical protein
VTASGELVFNRTIRRPIALSIVARADRILLASKIRPPPINTVAKAIITKIGTGSVFSLYGRFITLKAKPQSGLCQHP